MNKGKLQVLYIISVLALLMIFSNRNYISIEELSFIVPVIIVSLLIGVIGVYLFGKDMKLYKYLYFICYMITIGFVFVPVLGVYIEDGSYYYGFPAQWFNYYSNGYVNFELGGFVFNYFIVYLILRFLTKIFLRFSNDNYTETNN
ncbi:hypothetical protein H8S33_18670 [Ornithinibacillus sp. BX22]|uniref:Uncharacterized protein n=2 Tax=Ornithinibacillus TaxID=484508 RepID=A0A923RL90_9BACI|nr:MULTISPECIES: hypothetical protein [Ornithinibacillus]MBC5638798.1 hypothetical protein [Ornithinibacillus hominis]MBS3679794.1 hypothetical protein [Ornithinibacillus massiliensis]